MKLKTRLIIAFFVILFVPFLMFAVAFFGFSKYQMRMIEQSYGVPMSLESLSDSMQVIGKSTEQIFNKLKVQAKEDPDQFLDRDYLDQVNETIADKPSYLLVRKDDKLYYSGTDEDVTKLFAELPAFREFSSSFRWRLLHRKGCTGVCEAAGCRIFRWLRGQYFCHFVGKDDGGPDEASAAEPDCFDCHYHVFYSDAADNMDLSGGQYAVEKAQ